MSTPQKNIHGEMAERSKAAVLKTVVVRATWGSNPYLSAIKMHKALCLVFFYAKGLGIAPQKVFNFGVFKTARSVEFTSLEMRIGSYETNNITNLDK